MSCNKFEIYVIFTEENNKCPKDFCGIVSDIEKGDNIANKISYCELRAQYYVWKNELFDKEYVGFYHFRRYLDFSHTEPLDSHGSKKVLPYRIAESWADTNVDIKDMYNYVSKFDVIAPIKEYTGLTVRQKYENSSGHKIQDLGIVENIIEEKYPHMVEAKEKYLSGKGEYYCNIFIMKTYLFDNYCKWLFSILEEFDMRVENSLPRTNGYLGERLFGIYFTWLCSSNNVKCGELPRVHFWCYDDRTHNFRRKRIKNFFINPGSKIWGILRKDFFLIRRMFL